MPTRQRRPAWSGRRPAMSALAYGLGLFSTLAIASAMAISRHGYLGADWNYGYPLQVLLLASMLVSAFCTGLYMLVSALAARFARPVRAALLGVASGLATAIVISTFAGVDPAVQLMILLLCSVTFPTVSGLGNPPVAR